MKHSWQELTDGTAKCRRCGALRSRGSKMVRVRTEIWLDEFGNEHERVEGDNATVLVVTGGHPFKCRPTPP
jgi:hypothetical protein